MSLPGVSREGLGWLPTRSRPFKRGSGSSMTGPREMFEFREVQTSSDGEIDLVLERREPAHPERGDLPCYHFRITPHGSSERVGLLRLRVGSEEELFFPGHIGYEVDPPFRGHHYAEKAVRLVLPVARAQGFQSVVVTCRPDNLASRRTLERLGARPLGEFEVPRTHEMYPKYVRHGGAAGAPILRYELATG